MKKATATRLALLTLLALSVTVLASSCAEDEPAADPLWDHLAQNWGITLSGFAGLDSEQFEVLDDGTAVTRAEGTLHVEALGSMQIAIDERVAPQSLGGATTVVLAGPGEDNIVYLAFEPVTNRLIFGDLTNEMGVDANPDGTFRVWRFDQATEEDETIAVTDGVGSFQHVEANGGLEDDAPHLLLMGFVLGHLQLFEARSTNYKNPGTIMAGTPVACDVFPALCDCVACYALDGAGCTPCPTLDP